MKSKIIICLMAAIILSGCDKSPPESFSLSSSGTTHQPVKPNLTRMFSTEVLTGSREGFEKPVGEGQSPQTLVHDTPPMDKKARGYYSYLGAANEFKAICGFEMPDWIEPMEGHYYITQHGKQFVSLARLEYKIDPSRRDELATLIMNGTATKRHGLPAITFALQPIEGKPAAKTSGYSLKQPDGRADEFSMVLFADGRVTLSNTRGPEGWDQ